MNPGENIPSPAPRQLTDADRPKILRFFLDHWGANIIVSRGRVHHAKTLEGFLLENEGEIEALITCHVDKEELEIVTLDSLRENRGAGTVLMECAVEKARALNCRRVWLITTNDNTRAIRFYQRRGFDLVAVHRNAMEEARRLKPQIPLTGFDGLPIRHEVEFELVLTP